VTIPKADPSSKTFPTGTPTGTIANGSLTDFLLAAGAPADFIFSTIDERLPRGFVPFNVQAIGNDIVVTFVLHQEGNKLETDGPDLGYVDIFSSDGQLLRRLEHGDWLYAPWGGGRYETQFRRC
jgi:hypothetical protein